MWKAQLRTPMLGAPPSTALCIAPSSREQVLTVESASALRCENSGKHPFHICVQGKIIKGSEPLYLRMYFPLVVLQNTPCVELV